MASASLYLPSGIDRSASFFRGANGENYNLDKHLGRGACTRDAPSIDPPPIARVPRLHPFTDFSCLPSILCAALPTDGEVWSAIEKKSSDKVAIKKIANCFGRNTEAKRILREVRILRHLSSPHIIRTRDMLQPDSEEKQRSPRKPRC